MSCPLCLCCAHLLQHLGLVCRGQEAAREMCVNFYLIAREAVKLEANLIPEIQGIAANKIESCGYYLT